MKKHNDATTQLVANALIYSIFEIARLEDVELTVSSISHSRASGEHYMYAYLERNTIDFSPSNIYAVLNTERSAQLPAHENIGALEMLQL